MKFINNGRIDYNLAQDQQKKIVEQKKKDKAIEDHIIFSEFNHVITLGRNSKQEHLIASCEFLLKNNIEVLKIDRGGDITYHGPGQLVIYPIIDLKNRGRDVHKYIRDLEQVIINFLSDFNINAKRVDGFTGVWIDNKKIASIGIGISGWITYHGIGLNINTDLSFFDTIVPCGISDKKMVSLSDILNKDITIDDVINKIKEKFNEISAGVA